MYAVVASGITGIFKTQKELDTILAIYPYPKFSIVRTEQEGRAWISANSRSFAELHYYNYGNTCSTGYLSVEYFIMPDRIVGNIDSTKLGNVGVDVMNDPDISVERKESRFRFIIKGINLNGGIIQHHVIAIHNILAMLGDYVDVVVTVPDVSIYLACTKYAGSNKQLLSFRSFVEKRLGEVAYTVKEKF